MLKTLLLIFSLFGFHYLSASDVVLGSLVVDCQNNVIYSTEGTGKDARFTSEFIDEFGNSTLKWNKNVFDICPRSVDELRVACNDFYGNDVSDIVRGPSMFPMDGVDGLKHLVRPLFCLKSQYYNPSLLSPNGCIFRVLSTGNTNQPEKIEQLAIDNCENVSMQLYQAMPLINENSFYHSIEYVCCPKMDKSHSNWDPKVDPYGIKTPLISYNDFKTKYTSTDSSINQNNKYSTVGSFVINCEKSIIFTKVHQNAQADTTNALDFEWIEREDLKNSYDCRNINEVAFTPICKQLYPYSDIKIAMAGSSNIRLFHDEKIFRPIWCLTSPKNEQESLPKANICTRQFEYKSDICLSQEEMETIARQKCSQVQSIPGEMNILYSSLAHDYCPGSAWLAGGYRRISYVCCRKDSAVELLLLNEFSQSMPKQDVPVLGESSLKSIQKAYDRVKDQLLKNANLKTQDLTFRFVRELKEEINGNYPDSYKEKALVTFNDAIIELHNIWKGEEDTWAKVEADEFNEAESKLSIAENAADLEIVRGLNNSELNLLELQTGLSHLLYTLNDVVVENLRHLTAIKEQQPWRFLPLNKTRKIYNRGDSLLTDPIYLSEVYDHILKFVNHAREKILTLRKIFWSRAPKQTYIVSLTNSYDTLQATLKNALSIIEDLDKTALSHHGNNLDNVSSLEQEMNTDLERKHESDFKELVDSLHSVAHVKIDDYSADNEESDKVVLSRFMIIKLFWILGVVMLLFFIVIFIILLLRWGLKRAPKIGPYNGYYKCEDIDYSSSMRPCQKSPDLSDVLNKINSTRNQNLLKRSDSTSYLYSGLNEKGIKGLENPVFQYYNP